MELSPRQTSLLKSIVEESTESSEPISSQIIVQKYLPHVSSATIRNEMVKLTDIGLLAKPHTSAGRVPTSVGIRFYIGSLMEESSLPVLEEVAIKQRLWQERFELDKLLRNAALALAETSGVLGIIATNDGVVVSAGAANILDHPEFFDIDVTRAVLSVLDKGDILSEIFGRATGEKDVHVLIGDEIGFPGLSNCGVIFSPFTVGRRAGRISLFGPHRMRYQKFIPLVRYVRNVVNEIGRAW